MTLCVFASPLRLCEKSDSRRGFWQRRGGFAETQTETHFFQETLT